MGHKRRVLASRHRIGEQVWLNRNLVFLVRRIIVFVVFHQDLSLSGGFVHSM
jgi:hypothetical protein